MVFAGIIQQIAINCIILMLEFRIVLLAHMVVFLALGLSVILALLVSI
jgi:hypothetical protein